MDFRFWPLLATTGPIPLWHWGAAGSDGLAA